MGLFGCYWGEANNPANKTNSNRSNNGGLDSHEEAHRRAAQRLGISTRIWREQSGRARCESSIGSNSRAGAIIEMAGVLAGGGDSADDLEAAKMLCREAGMTLDEATAEARRLMR